jgi:hypothetical protein
MKVAVVTDSALGDVAEHLASHFVSAEIKHFPGGETESARTVDDKRGGDIVSARSLFDYFHRSRCRAARSLKT